MRYYPDYRFAVAFQVNTDINRDGFAEAIQNRLALLVAESLKRSNK
jgi:hypothetical protein